MSRAFEFILIRGSMTTECGRSAGTRIEMTSVDRRTGNEVLLVLEASGAWRRICTGGSSGTGIDSGRLEADAGHDIVRAMFNGLAVEDLERRTYQKDKIKGFWFVRFFFEGIPVRSVSGPVLPRAISELERADLLLMNALKLDCRIFTV